MKVSRSTAKANPGKVIKIESHFKEFFNAVFHNTVTVTIFTILDNDKYWG
jgi:hypothetical protein